MTFLRSLVLVLGVSTIPQILANSTENEQLVEQQDKKVPNVIRETYGAPIFLPPEHMKTREKPSDPSDREYHRLSKESLMFENDEDGNLTLRVPKRTVCDTCHLTLDISTQLLRRKLGVIGASQYLTDDPPDEWWLKGKQLYAANHLVDWTIDDIIQDVCVDAMRLLRPAYSVSCRNFITQFGYRIFAPYIGQTELKSLFADQLLLEHKINFCLRTDQCPFDLGISNHAVPSSINTPKKRTRCEACTELAADARVMLGRLFLTLPSVASSTVLSQKSKFEETAYDMFTRNWCSSLSLRHFRPNRLADLCDSFLNDYEDEFKAFLTSGPDMANLLENEVAWEEHFCSIASVCKPGQLETVRRGWEDASVVDLSILELQRELEKHARVFGPDHEGVLNIQDQIRDAENASQNVKTRRVWALPNSQYIPEKVRETIDHEVQYSRAQQQKEDDAREKEELERQFQESQRIRKEQEEAEEQFRQDNPELYAEELRKIEEAKALEEAAVYKKALEDYLENEDGEGDDGDDDDDNFDFLNDDEEEDGNDNDKGNGSVSQKDEL